jgi:hypothetical protein
MSLGSMPMAGPPAAPPPGEAAGPAGREEFYAAFTARNRGLVSDDEQRQLRGAVILVAGCGSIGGAVVEPLVRLGAERLVLGFANELVMFVRDEPVALWYGDLGAGAGPAGGQAGGDQAAS